VVWIVFSGIQVEVYQDDGVVDHDAAQQYRAEQRVEVQRRFDYIQRYDDAHEAQGYGHEYDERYPQRIELEAAQEVDEYD
jgi:hypothetical protein